MSENACTRPARWEIYRCIGDPLSSFACDEHKEDLIGDGDTARRMSNDEQQMCCFLRSPTRGHPIGRATTRDF